MKINKYVRWCLKMGDVCCAIQPTPPFLGNTTVLLHAHTYILFPSIKVFLEMCMSNRDQTAIRAILTQYNYCSVDDFYEPYNMSRRLLFLQVQNKMQNPIKMSPKEIRSPLIIVV